MYRLMRPVGLILVALAMVASARALDTVEEAMDSLVARLYAQKDPAALAALDEATLLNFITPEERNILATRYLHFDVDKPAVVSVLRETGQATVPFWLEAAGFAKTSMVVTNTGNWRYEVWQKTFDAGHVGLGINGFDKHRPHYFVTVGAATAGEPVQISNLFPAQFSIGWVHEGAFVYHDWDSLLLKEVPEELQGQQLLTTIRGRAREAHLIGGFRTTATPSSSSPDQILLTWNGDPRDTQAIQWRTGTAVEDGVVRFQRKDEQGKTVEVAAVRERIEDRVLMNDPHCHRFTATLTGLKPGTTYTYQVGSPKEDLWSSPAEFTTAPKKPAPFTFITFGDTHKKPHWGQMLQAANKRHPEAAFYMIAGDLVDTGQYRDDWDQFFDITGGVFAQRPLIPTIGNHDAIDGLGAGMYRAHFALPGNGPDNLLPEHTFTVQYGNVQFFILDSGLPVLDQADWLEQQLAASTADWKIAMFHFPPYNIEEGYPDIAALWGYLFDKYHMDLVLEGHVHYYMRSHPLRRGRPVEDPNEGTIHLISIGIENEDRVIPPTPYAKVAFSGTPLYQVFHVDGKRLTMRTLDPQGNERDSLVLQK
jgi:hypothetical protein